ncbi:MAG: hypothetical protein JKY37_30545 [Nannocystaceae bacterium]|nr:hypothetical protein [Nannocystaceae bacterium]
MSTLLTSRLQRSAASVARAVAALVIGLCLYLGAFGVAHAEEGKPSGWDVSAATRSARIGTMTLQWEPAVTEEAYELITVAPLWWSEIEAELAGDVDDRVTITFLEHAGGVADASGMPRWVAGVAHSSTGEILIARYGPDGDRTNLEELLKHEMSHVVLYRALDGREVPRWFNEGVAENFTGSLSLSRAQTLATAVFGPGVPDFERLEQHFRGTDSVDASVAYAAARDFVSFLRGQPNGDMHLRQVISEVRDGHKFEVSIIKAYDRSLEELSTEWRSGLRGRFVWYPMIAGGGLPFALVAPLIALAWVRRRRVLADGWARLEAQDEAERAARSALLA